MKNLIATLVIGISAAQLMGADQMNATAANGNDGAVASKAALPASLVGQWESGSLAATNFYDASTQQWQAPNGRGMFLVVLPNGEYRFGAGEQIATTQYFIYQEGTVAIQGSEIVFSPKAGSDCARDINASQRQDQHASRPQELQPSTFQFRIVPDQANAHGAKLMLSDVHGKLVTLQASAR